MPSQLALIAERPELLTLPSAKIRKPDKAGVHGWTEFYASFSEKFVVHALLAMGAEREATVYDPFLGSGTTAVGGIKLGLDVVGLDIDPFACLLSRAKISTRADGKVVRSILQGSALKRAAESFPPDAQRIFSVECLRYAGGVFNRVLKRTGLSKVELLERLLHDSTGVFDSEVVAITALCIAATDAARLVQGSNPTWFRNAAVGEQVQSSTLRQATLDTVGGMLADLDGLGTIVTRRSADIRNVDYRLESREIQQGFADYVVTSPPYLTRIDYVVKHLPNLLLLSGLVDVDVDDLRKKMIGTSKILEKQEAEFDWGETASKVIAEIRDHPSYASARYYKWVYQQYFKATFECISVITRALRPTGKGVIVVQDAFYKDVFIDLSIITIEMLSKSGHMGRVVRSEPIKTNLRQLNPRRSRSSSIACESVVYFQLESPPQ